MKLFSILFCSVFALTASAQSLRQANSLFDKYEYVHASRIYAAYAQSHRLSFDDYQKLTYCYFITGDYANAGKMSDSIISQPNADPYFYFVNGQSNMAIGNYANAKTSFKRYKSLGGEENIEAKLSTLESIENWETVEHVENGLFGFNGTKSDVNGSMYSFGSIEFFELGQDSAGNFVQQSVIDASELVLSRPHVRSRSGELTPIQLEKQFRDAAITSFALNESTGEAWVTVAQPLKKDKLDKVPHLYHGTFDPKTYTLTSLSPWKYSGYEDGSACAHATLDPSGTTLVFSKIAHTKHDADLFVSRKANDAWSQPERIANLASSGDEMYPLFMGDTLLSFSSDGHLGYGGLDIFTSTVNGTSFDEKQHIKAPINSFADDFNLLKLSADSVIYSSNRSTGKGDDDKYLLVYSRPIPVEVVDTVFEVFVAEWETPIIYFDFNQAAIIDVEKLDELIVFMKTYPESILMVEGHSDSRGKEAYNYKLALNRAESVRLELGQKGLNLNQIFVESKGSLDPQVDCGGNCSEEDHAKNRFARILLITK